MSVPPVLNPAVIATDSPPIPQIQAHGLNYAGARGGLIDLCQAVPAHAPPPEMLDVLAKAAASPQLARYGDIPGDLILRENYAQHLQQLYDARVSAEQVCITAGCNQAFFVTMMTIAAPGDAVMLPTPWYFDHAMTLDMRGIETRALPCSAESGFIPDPDAAEALIDSRLRAIVLVTPNNPTGAVYPAEVVARFQALCERHGLWLILDETYRDFLPPDRARGYDLLAGRDWPDNLVQLYSFSKSFAMPGHRLGALTAPRTMIGQAVKVMDCVQICAPRPAQAAVAWGLGALAAWREANREEMNRRAETVRTVFRTLTDWRLDSLGAYFAYVRHPFRGASATTVSAHLALEHGVMCLPGSAFGGQDDHLRVAFANVDCAGIEELGRRLSGVPIGPEING